METKGGKKPSSSSSSKSFYEAPLGYSIEDVRPNGGIKKFRSAAYSNVSTIPNSIPSITIPFSLSMNSILIIFFFSFYSALANHPDIP